MSERKYRQPEQQRATGRSERRYGQRGQQTGEFRGRTAGQTSQQTSEQDTQLGQQDTQSGQHGTQSGQQSPQATQQSPQASRQSPQASQQSQQMGGQQARERHREAPIRPITVNDIAATEVVTTSPDAPVTDVARKMANENVGAVVVVEQHRPIGIVTDRKITLALADTPDVSRMRVSDLMTEDVFTVSENTNVFDLIRELSDRGVRRAPVVSDRGDLRGIVSLDDAIVLLAEEFHNVGQIIRKQSPRL